MSYQTILLVYTQNRENRPQESAFAGPPQRPFFGRKEKRQEKADFLCDDLSATTNLMVQI